MERSMNEWTGQWENFENYMESSDENMVACWKEAEAAGQMIPMFSHGVKAFWKKACKTITDENPVQIYGWNVTGKSSDKNRLTIEWLVSGEQSAGAFDYVLDSVVEQGLESKPNYLLRAENAPDGCPFACILAMPPMPERAALKQGGLLSHFHFQFAGSRDKLLNEDGSLVNPMWYATMCSAEGDLLDKCNIVRALHRLPKWEKLK